MKLSILIVGYKEERTIGAAIEAFLHQDLSAPYEMLLVAPDAPTLSVMQSYARKHRHIRVLRDHGQGKPSALNLLFEQARGDILILSDGDVAVAPGAVAELLKPFIHSEIGAVCGRPVSVNSRSIMLGYFSHLLTDVGAHHTRLAYRKKKKFIVCSGYLFAMRNFNIRIPSDSLSDDAIISHMIAERGYTIAYAPNALVYVKFPTTLSDWFLQKRRSAGGYEQLKQYFPGVKRMRSLKEEVLEGFYKPFLYPRCMREFFWTLLLYPLRLFLWLCIFYDIYFKKRSFRQTWRRVLSTK